jgi:glutaredoxin-related protein/uncharacterized membrane protein
MNGNYLSSLAFLIVGIISSLYFLLEAVLQLFGKSICPTEGCKIVSQYTRFGDLTMVLLGLGTVAVISALAAKGMRSVSETRDRIINFLLVVSLAGEGFFVGYQLFRLHAICIFCLSVFGIFVVLGILRVLAGHREVLAGFGALAAILTLFYLILPTGGTALPLDQKYILFYSPDCKHCAEIRKELEANKIEFKHVEVKEYAPFLKNLGIEHVPTLLVNGKYEKYFLTGIDAIRNHLFCKPGSAPAGKAVKKISAAAREKKNTSAAPAGQLNLFAPSATPNSIFNPLPDEGLCKEDVKCD